MTAPDLSPVAPRSGGAKRLVTATEIALCRELGQFSEREERLAAAYLEIVEMARASRQAPDGCEDFGHDDCEVCDTGRKAIREAGLRLDRALEEIGELPRADVVPMKAPRL